jgi:hypothetical protein
VRRLVLACFAAVVTMLASGRCAQAMPVFAEAYGYDCQKCHIQVPALNSFGRYVQRSMYAALDRKTLSSIPPVWLGEAAFSDTQDPNESHKLQFGNLAVHLSGFLSKDVTTHIQQWLVKNDEAGPLDTAWISYDHIFGPNTHVVFGKQAVPGPSSFSQWMDLAPFAVPDTVVGEHVQEFEDNRWGTKVGWTNSYFTADIGWFGSEADLNGATDFSDDTEKAIQWNVAYAPFDRPIQIGGFGGHGTEPLTEGGIDRFAGTGAYFQVDQTPHAPGVLLLYQRGWEGNAGKGNTNQLLGPAASGGMIAELFFKPLRHYEGLVSLREELSNNGLGTVMHTGNADINFRVARFIHATLEWYAQSLGKPGFRYQVWWTTPLQKER